MKKILKLQCDTCNRTIDKIINVNHYETDKCNITLGCAGRLFPLQYKASADIAVAPEIGTIDWSPRGSNARVVSELPEDQIVTLSTGTSNQLTIAVQVDDLGAGSTLLLPIIIKGDSPKQFRQYTYVREQSFSTISGVETGLEKKTLRYNRTGDTIDTVEVYVDGVKKEMGSDPDQFQINNGSPSSSVPPNTIRFNSEIVVSKQSQVDIVISKYAPAIKKYLPFVRNSKAVNLVGAWNDIRFIERFQEGKNEWVRYMTYTCDLSKITDLPLNSHFTLADSISVPPINAVLPASAGAFLLARPPFSAIDRCHNVIIPFNTISERDHLKFFLEDNKKVIKIVTSAVEEVYPLIKTPPDSKISGVTLIKKQIIGSDSASLLDGKIIVGPDE